MGQIFRRPNTIAWGAASALVGALTLSSCTSGTPPPKPPPSPTASPTQTTESREGMTVLFAMEFDTTDTLAATADADVVVSQEEFFGGGLATVTAADGIGTALAFPPFADGEEEPGVGITVLGPGVPEPDPAATAFGFGADVRIEGGAQSSAADNGDNVIQRGLAADLAQYKLQVDNGRPSCSATGSAGRVLVKGDALVDQTWYRVACRLDATGMTLTVTDLDTGERGEFTEPGTVGAVTFDENVPLAIGRKAGADGVGILKQPDQFNGSLDAVWVGETVAP